MSDDRQPVVAEPPPALRYQTIETVGYAPDDDVNDLLAAGWKVVNVTILPWLDCYGCTEPRFFVSLIREDAK